MRQSDRPEELRLLMRATLFLVALLLADPLDLSPLNALVLLCI